MHLDAAVESRRAILAAARPNTWIALSADESRVIAEGNTFEATVHEAEQSGEADPVILLVPEDWNLRVL